MDDEVDVGDEGSEAVGLAVGLGVESEAGKAVLGEEDWGGLEGPVDIVAIAKGREGEIEEEEEEEERRRRRRRHEFC
ncbi:hypothetical protein M0R45_030568 [Rubus argutus]|uniref:Uncharacterized protein n=1 Tax=Rubus argutus TaxID=59490 RepID=A0AAW1WBI3_RUBAR